MKRGRRGSPLVVTGRTSRLGRAFDELQFGAARTLNLRESLPVPDEAVRRVEVWLRERQVSASGEVLVITGRGNRSHGGVSPVREAVHTHLGRMRRMGVVQSVREHTPGSFVVTLAPVSSLFAAPKSRRHDTGVSTASTTAIEGLGDTTRRQLLLLASRYLESLGISRPTDSQVRVEMERRFSLLLAALPDGAEREERLLATVEQALRDLDDEI